MRVLISFMAVVIGIFFLSRLSFIDIVYLVTQNKDNLIKNKYKVYQISVNEVQESKSFRTFMLCKIHIVNNDVVSFFTLAQDDKAYDFTEKVEKNDSLLIYYSNNLHDPHEVYNISKKKCVFHVSYWNVLIYDFLITLFIGIGFTNIGIAIFLRKAYLWDR